MNKFWEAVEKCHEPGKDLEIIHTLFHTKYESIGEIRELFDSWKVGEIASLLEDIEFSNTTDDGVSEETLFGERWAYSLHPVLESNLLDCSSSHVWSTLKPKKKRFF